MMAKLGLTLNPSKAEQAPARLVGVLRLRQPRQGVSGRRSLRRRPRARLPRQTAQDAEPGRAKLLPFGHLRRTESRLALETPSQPRAESLAVKPVGKPDAGNPPVRLCVQRRLACSAGDRPAGARVRGPVVWIAEAKETETLKPIDKVSLSGRSTSHRAVTKVNALWPRKCVPEGRAFNVGAKAEWLAEH